MLKNYFTIAWRHIRKDRVFSFITIFGLSVSIAVCILIFQYAIFELGYDRFNENADRIYRITANSYENNQKIYQSASSPQKIGPAIKEGLAEVLQAARLVSTRGWFDCTLRYNTRGNAIIFNERNLYFADPSLFSIFSFPLKSGDNSQALEKPYSAVLSETAARRYFGDEDAIGKVLRLKGSFDENDYIVTGIMTDLPPDSHIDADILLSISSLERNPYYNNFDAYTYVLLAPGTSPEAMRVKLHDFVSAYLPTLNVDKTQIQLDIQPVTEIHLYSSLEDEIRPGGNARSIYFMLLVAFSILLIAWINYINLATARSISRAKEVGIRKVSGANRSQLVKQFLMESIITNALGISLALVLVYFLSPLFHQITGLTLSYDRLFELGLSRTGLLTAFIFCAGIFLSGLYPARVISSHNPALVLKGKFSGKGGGINLRKALVVFQFTCAIG